ncbi:ester cyclase [Natrarchaeobaculum aegyptiacum]|uniref:Ester cyclase n=1 Tax=Natrarchaeobaculum aegyptiacum TaxID=745377 RepID=A0A2Z2HSZ8_9EURY|nr:ester cyclase [Natrarchaeobaculum aegyptiacum]ARS90336.1 ester cyclase [Natrarchaeobaculum aegyptiacum]
MTTPTELVRRDPEEIWTDGSLEVIDDIFADSFVLHDPAAPDDPRDRDAYRSYVESYREAFPDVEYEVEDVIADDDRVALRYTARGTHEGSFMGLEPTGDHVEVSGVEIYRVEDEEIVEMWTNYDALGLFQELGVVPSLEEFATED